MRVTVNHNRRHKRQRGITLPETLIALVLFMLVLTSLLNYQRGISQGFQQQWQYRTIWRLASQQTEIDPPPPPTGFQISRQQTTMAQCLHVTVTVTSPQGRQARLSRLHCPVR